MPDVRTSASQHGSDLSPGVAAHRQPADLDQVDMLLKSEVINADENAILL